MIYRAKTPRSYSHGYIINHPPRGVPVRRVRVLRAGTLVLKPAMLGASEGATDVASAAQALPPSMSLPLAGL